MLKALVATAMLSAVSLSAFAQMTPEGLWRSIDDETQKPKAEIRIKGDSVGVLNGKIDKALTQGAEPNCTKCTDDRKDKPKVGMEIIRGAKKTEGKDLWEGGQILDPENGKTYTLRMTPLDGGKQLQVRGYIGPFYRTQIWQRIE
jgi:uncharacterized protein (DUF2147 family)